MYIFGLYKTDIGFVRITFLRCEQHKPVVVRVIVLVVVYWQHVLQLGRLWSQLTIIPVYQLPP